MSTDIPEHFVPPSIPTAVGKTLTNAGVKSVAFCLFR